VADFSSTNAFAIPGLLQSAVTHFRAGQLQQAAVVCDRILANGPAHPDALHLLGIIRLQSHRPADAAELIRHAIAIDPRVAAYHKNLAESLRQLRDLRGAEQSYRAAIAINPNDAQSLSNLAGILRLLDRRNESIELLERATKVNPTYPQGFNNLGTTLVDVGRLDEAEAALRSALRLDPSYASAWSNLGLVYMRREDSVAALSHLDRAIALNPNYADAHWHRAMALLIEGDLGRGWREYDWRFMTTHSDTVRNKPVSLLLPGTDVRGVRIHCCSEQGLGDTIQFARFALELRDLGADVSLDAAPELRELFKSLPVTITPREAPAPPADVITPLMSLPIYFGTTIETIPRREAYLSIDPAKGKQWRERIGAFDGLRIGIVAEGAARHPNNANRNCAIEHWKPLFDLPKTMWFNLGLPALRETPANVIDLSPYLIDMSETAAAMANLDLIVSVDTSTAHLAGALGRPVWILLPTGPDWRWLLKREDSPWYASARLFRQARRGDWPSVIARIRDAIGSAGLAGDA
jgi:tetratricopeptide (TPR) repeat protein